MRGQRGISLVEVVIGLVFVTVFGVICIPKLIHSEISTNEAAAVSSLQTIKKAQNTYELAYPELGYADHISKLFKPSAGKGFSSNSAGLLDWTVGCKAQPCPKAGYQFSVVPNGASPVDGYHAIATPLQVGKSGVRGFCSDHLGHMMFDPQGGSACTKPFSE